MFDDRAEKGEPLLLEEPKLVAIADRLQKTVAQVILRYLIQRNVIVIPKSATPHRIQSNFDVRKNIIVVVSFTYDNDHVSIAIFASNNT